MRHLLRPEYLQSLNSTIIQAGREQKPTISKEQHKHFDSIYKTLQNKKDPKQKILALLHLITTLTNDRHPEKIAVFQKLASMVENGEFELQPSSNSQASSSKQSSNKLRQANSQEFYQYILTQLEAAYNNIIANINRVDIKDLTRYFLTDENNQLTQFKSLIYFTDLLREFDLTPTARIETAKSLNIKDFVCAKESDLLRQIILFNNVAKQYGLPLICREDFADSIPTSFQDTSNQIAQHVTYEEVVSTIADQLARKAKHIPPAEYLVTTNGENFKISCQSVLLSVSATVGEQQLPEEKSKTLEERQILLAMKGFAASLVDEVTNKSPTTLESSSLNISEKYFFIGDEAFKVSYSNMQQEHEGIVFIPLKITHLLAKDIASLLIDDIPVPTKIFLNHLPTILTEEDEQRLSNLFARNLQSSEDRKYFLEHILPSVAELINSGYMMKKIMRALPEKFSLRSKLFNQFTDEKLIQIIEHSYTATAIPKSTVSLTEGILSPSLEDIAAIFEQSESTTKNPAANLNGILRYLSPGEIEIVATLLAKDTVEGRSSSKLDQILTSLPSIATTLEELDDPQKSALFPYIQQYMVAQCTNTNIEPTNKILCLLPLTQFAEMIIILQQIIDHFLTSITNYLTLTQDFKDEQKSYFFAQKLNIIIDKLTHSEELQQLFLTQLDQDNLSLIKAINDQESKLTQIVPNIDALLTALKNQRPETVVNLIDQWQAHIINLILNGSESIEKVADLIALFSPKQILMLGQEYKRSEQREVLYHYLFSPENFSTVMAKLNSEQKEAFLSLEGSLYESNNFTSDTDIFYFGPINVASQSIPTHRIFDVETVYQLRRLLENSDPAQCQKIMRKYDHNKIAALLGLANGKVPASTVVKLGELLDLRPEQLASIYGDIKDIFPIAAQSIADATLVLSRLPAELRRKSYNLFQPSFPVMMPESSIAEFTKSVNAILIKRETHTDQGIMDPVNVAPQATQYKKYIEKYVASAFPIDAQENDQTMNLNMLTFFLTSIYFRDYSAFIPLESVSLADLHRANLVLRYYPEEIDLSLLVEKLGRINSEELVKLSYGLTLNRFKAFYEVLIAKKLWEIKDYADFIFVLNHFTVAQCKVMRAQLDRFNIEDLKQFKHDTKSLNPRDFSFLLDIGSKPIKSNASALVKDDADLYYILSMADRKQTLTICHSLGEQLAIILSTKEKYHNATAGLDPVIIRMIKTQWISTLVTHDQTENGRLRKLLSISPFSILETFALLRASHPDYLSNPRPYQTSDGMMDWEIVAQTASKLHPRELKSLLASSSPIPSDAMAQLLTSTLDDGNINIGIFRQEIEAHCSESKNILYLIKVILSLSTNHIITLNYIDKNKDGWIAQQIANFSSPKDALNLFYDQLNENPTHSFTILKLLREQIVKNVDSLDSLMKVLSLLSDEKNEELEKQKLNFVQKLAQREEIQALAQDPNLIVQALIKYQNGNSVQCNMLYSLLGEKNTKEFIHAIVRQVSIDSQNDALNKIPFKGVVIQQLIQTILVRFDHYKAAAGLPSSIADQFEELKSQSANPIREILTIVSISLQQDERVLQPWSNACDQSSTKSLTWREQTITVGEPQQHVGTAFSLTQCVSILFCMLPSPQPSSPSSTQSQARSPSLSPAGGTE